MIILKYYLGSVSRLLLTKGLAQYPGSLCGAVFEHVEHGPKEDLLGRFEHHFWDGEAEIQHKVDFLDLFRIYLEYICV